MSKPELQAVPEAKTSADTNGDAIKLVDAAAENVFDDIETLRKTATLKVSRRVVAVNVSVRKPANNVYFRCHDDPKMSLDASIIIGDNGSDDYYFVTPYMLNHHVILPRLRKVRIAVVYSWPGGAISLWPVPMVEETRIACWKSARAGTATGATMTWQLPKASPPNRCGRTISISAIY